MIHMDDGELPSGLSRRANRRAAWHEVKTPALLPVFSRMTHNPCAF
jgi:hypothetical protein